MSKQSDDLRNGQAVRASKEDGKALGFRKRNPKASKLRIRAGN